MSLAKRNLELMKQVEELQKKVWQLDAQYRKGDIAKMRRELELAKEIHLKAKKEHHEEYRILNKKYQEVVLKLSMIRDFTEDLTRIFPVTTGSTKREMSQAASRKGPAPVTPCLTTSAGSSFKTGK